MTKQFEAENEPADLGALLEHVALVSDVDNLEEDAGAVRMMTFHGAKGLEFPVVFMVGMEEGVFPHSRSQWEPEELEEERRLCYVGITRAMERLFLTSAKQRTLYGNTTLNYPSRFLEEIPEELVEVDLDGSLSMGFSTQISSGSRQELALTGRGWPRPPGESDRSLRPLSLLLEIKSNTAPLASGPLSRSRIPRERHCIQSPFPM